MGLHLALASPLDVPRLASELGLSVDSEGVVPEGHGGHSVTELVLALRGSVGLLDLVTLDPGLEHPVELFGDGVRLAVGPLRPRARTRSIDLFSTERDFIANRLATWMPSAVSAHWTYEYALGSLDSGLPTLVTVRDWAPTVFRYHRDPYRAVRWLMQRITFHRASHFAAVSPYMAALVERRVRTAVSVLPNILNRDWFQHTEGTEVHPKWVLSVNSGFSALKNVHSLLRAWPLVLEQVPDAKLLLVGAGYEALGPAHRWCRDAGLDSGIEFVGAQPRSEIAHLLRRSAMLMHPSLEESFGMAVLEAMACATPVIGGMRSGAVPWLLGDGAGVLIDVQSPKEIAGAVVSLIHDPIRAAILGERGRSRAVRDFSAEPVAASYIGALTGLASTS